MLCLHLIHLNLQGGPELSGRDEAGEGADLRGAAGEKRDGDGAQRQWQVVAVQGAGRPLAPGGEQPDPRWPPITPTTPLADCRQLGSSKESSKNCSLMSPAMISCISSRPHGGVTSPQKNAEDLS